MWLLLLTACSKSAPTDTLPTADSDATVDTDAATETEDPTNDSDPAPDTDGAPVDADADGWIAPDDCDDARDWIHPEAPEIAWNGTDDDCDGRVDGDGTFVGSLVASARAVYEGSPHEFALSCPGNLDSAGGTFALAMTCTQDPTDALAMLLLGGTLQITTDGTLNRGSWTGRVTIDSSNGWDTRGDATLAYDGLDRIQATVSLNAVSLKINGAATMDRTTAPL
jgi:hypothetical protein